MTVNNTTQEMIKVLNHFFKTFNFRLSAEIGKEVDEQIIIIDTEANIEVAGLHEIKYMKQQVNTIFEKDFREVTGYQIYTLEINREGFQEDIEFEVVQLPNDAMKSLIGALFAPMLELPDIY